MEEIHQKNDEEDELLSSLPKVWAWGFTYMYNYKGFWYRPQVTQSMVSCQKHFEAQNTDTIIATFPKSGTTWLKALSFAILTRAQYPSSQSPLLSFNPHHLVPFLEFELYLNKPVPDLSALPSPRIFGTHMAYSLLPESIQNSTCRVVYICRNPLDAFVSLWHFINKGVGETLPLEECFDDFCQGIAGCGPFFDHVLGYWKQSLERPYKVLFLTYEDLKEDTTGTHLKRLAEFLGCPFSLEEERDGVIEEISKLCSFNMLKDMEHNKTGNSILDFENKTLFRRGEVGDWINLLTPEMVERLTNIMEQKLAGSGIVFKLGP
ncbi:hypothetical protein Tsubulata_007116 [Turnera subulata]|uniref:Sulfotransferase n=1 Tax=Turnera subulata TaxID=218843 RepID=A0A9Q0JPW8_9ROSI|nr:hypothetical protein Tsubulata_007116 [Turnera subulata]